MGANKPILIDAVHITMGGGRMLLEILCFALLARKISFYLLRDARCRPLSSIDSQCEYVISGEVERRDFYKRNTIEFGSILCFANIPPTIKQKCPVYTYFHNINLLKIPSGLSFKRKIISFLKRLYISYYSRHTDSWIVQTQNTEDCLRKALPCNGKAISQMPFYRRVIPLNCNQVRKDYILVGDYTGTRGHDELLKAWEVLKKQGINAVLHLTVSKDNPFSNIIDTYVKMGVPIINHGIIPFEEVCELYCKCKATIYPSVNESLGLGIIEAIDAGCDVIGVDLPYVHSVCNPTLTFKNITPEEIAGAVLIYESFKVQKTTLKIQNKLDELINCLLN